MHTPDHHETPTWTEAGLTQALTQASTNAKHKSYEEPSPKPTQSVKETRSSDKRMGETGAEAPFYTL
ncbi:Hypothetical predicted protein [Pelobates cultripes]|uniref:Uncharacterized protein n=1 Tax=Pelobates cultripes TaxID=61616 RepID=A0AAD1W0W8_PELCU|nr:Hypothetical predicted protein [Pelobates cultripes]